MLPNASYAIMAASFIAATVTPPRRVSLSHRPSQRISRLSDGVSLPGTIKGAGFL
uniref:Uncharacterized protein n=1 Tax=Triticum urartu TaxID=4572 RepID=A0A8R7U7H9_TRIUA